MKTPVLLSILLFWLLLSACNLSAVLASPTPSPAKPPANSLTPAPTAKPRTPGSASTGAVSPPPPRQTLPHPTQELPVVYYYFVPPASSTRPAGSVVILKDVLILGPALSKSARSPDPATNLANGLNAAIRDSRNGWQTSGLQVASLSLKDGAARVELKGDILGAGDVVHIAARWQLLLTIFAEPAVQSAVVTLNGQNIANLGISHESEARPAGFAYTRAEIEKFLAENALP